MTDSQDSEIHSADVPQEDNLGDVRRTVEAIAAGLEDTESIAGRTARSKRHVGYAINAAIVLGFIAAGDDAISVLEAGKKLLEHTPGSPGELAVLRASIEACAILRELSPGLLAEPAPTRESISARIQARAELSKSTADRRAQTLLSWRRQILAPEPG